MSLELYRERVDRLALLKAGEPIFVGSLDQAAIVVEKLFSIAKSSVSILTSKLNARVYGGDSVREQVRLFLADPMHKVRIIIEAPDERSLANHPLIDVLPLCKTNLEIRSLPDKHQSLYDFHFMAVDGESYRFEKNRDEPGAIAAFGDKAGAKNMEGIFDQLWDLAQPVDAIPADAA